LFNLCGKELTDLINKTVGKIGIFEIAFLLTLVVVIILLLVMAASKLINCGLPNRDKILWVIALIIFNGVAAFSFILYHDYLLPSDARSKGKIF